MGASTELWFDFRSQPTVLELSLLLRMQAKGDSAASDLAWTDMSIAEVIYSFLLRVKAFTSSSMNL